MPVFEKNGVRVWFFFSSQKRGFAKVVISPPHIELSFLKMWHNLGLGVEI
jgi:hypothetical protein